MKILQVNQIQALDAYTIENEPISSIDLMERASQAFVQAFVGLFSPDCPIYVFCGLGNNGGDGLAVSRLLLDLGYSVKTWVVRYTNRSSPDFAINYQRLAKLIHIQDLEDIADFPIIPSNAYIIDALFGSGLSRPLGGLSAEVVQEINVASATRVALDIASGLYADTTSVGEAIVRADYTISFQLPKLAFLLPQNAPYVGEWHICPIGLSSQYIHNCPTTWYYLDNQWIKSILKPRTKFSHKGTYGHSLLLAGSYGKMGAAVLAARACLRAGTGLLTTHIPRCGYEIMQTAVPEAMISIEGSWNWLQHLPDIQPYAAIGVGCGLDKYPATTQLLEKLLKTATQPLVIDADALNIIAENPRLLNLLPPNSLLTPHPKEFARLTQEVVEDNFERLEVLRNFAQVYQVYIILKGAHSALATPQGEVYFNSTGNPGMASGGSGDVLTGIITALLAQGYSVLHAGILGMYLHGLAGDLALATESQQSLMASDIIENLGKAFKYIMR
ncbi:MAG: NAD(P)H-hydrate dehydratase [Microscillaceae bacterium]|jgi:NAD(P)H-hydrate epimerase|nr:NAD(P)H-hydrate dehydratase [Microscillaceae bacterium]